jgi:hypothetical protein
MRWIFLLSLAAVIAIVAYPSGGICYADDSGWTRVQIEPTTARASVTAGSVRVHLEEMLSNQCYRSAPVDNEVDLVNRRVVLNDYAFVRTGVMCPMMVTPISRSLDLGILPPGEWELWVTTSNGERGKTDEFVVQ